MERDRLARSCIHSRVPHEANWQGRQACSAGLVRIIADKSRYGASRRAKQLRHLSHRTLMDIARAVQARTWSCIRRSRHFHQAHHCIRTGSSHHYGLPNIRSRFRVSSWHFLR